MSQLFGGGSTSTEKPATARSTFTAAGVTPAPVRPQTTEAAMTRYTPTYKSNAFAHAQYEAPIKNNESAAVRTLKTTGTSIEDYGRRTQGFDKAAFVAAFAPAGKVTTNVKKEVVKHDDPNCPHCTNKFLIESKKDSQFQEKTSTLTFEQQRIAALRDAELSEHAKRKAAREANNSEMNATLSSIEERKRAEWEAKKNDTTNLQQSLKLQQEHQELTEKAIKNKLFGTEAYRNDLNRKREEAISLNIQGKISDKELERRLKGLQFECYQRDPIMKEETKKTGAFVKTQIADWTNRKQKEKEDFVAPPEVFYTDKELAALREQAAERSKEYRAHTSSYAKDQLNQHFTKVQQTQSERDRILAEEREMHNKMRELEMQDKEYKRRTRDERNVEMNTVVSSLTEQKRAEWDAKKTDQTNKLQTEVLQKEASELTKQAMEDSLRMKMSYNQDLSSLTAEQRARLEQDKERNKKEELYSRGFRFECYRRDPKMKEATRETGKFQKAQSNLGSTSKQFEKEVLVMPPPSLMTTEHLTVLQQEALQQENSKRSGLKTVMKSQYEESLAERQARIADEKRRDAEETARIAARNAELSRREREIAESTKKNYGEYLGYQQNQTELKKAQETAERRYDPHTERIVEENAMLAERVVKCNNCDGVLSHEKTYLDHRSNHI